MPAGQTDGDSFSVGVPFSQVSLVWVMLKELCVYIESRCVIIELILFLTFLLISLNLKQIII